jgi:thioredoxin reductase
MTAEVIAVSDAGNSKPENRTEYDVVVIGGGAAGLNAALVLARARRSVAVVDARSPRNAPSARMRGYLSRDGMPPSRLLEVGRAELAEYEADFIEARVELVEPVVPGYAVRLVGGATLTARRVVLATGLRDELPDIPGLRERWGKDVVFCPYCHGYEVRDQPLAVLGTHPGAVGHAQLLRQWSPDLVYFPHTQELNGDDRARLAARGIEIAEGAIKSLVVEDDRLRGVELADGRVVSRTTAFLVTRMVPLDHVLDGLDCEKDANGLLVTDRSGRTSDPGVWAVGNVADPRAQVITAAGMGAAAAFAINVDLVGEDVEEALCQR